MLTAELGGHVLAVLRRPSCLAVLAGRAGHHLLAVGGHLPAMLLHLLNQAPLQHRPQRDDDSDGRQSKDCPLHHRLPPPGGAAVSGSFLWAPFEPELPLTRASRRAWYSSIEIAPS